MGRFSLFFTVFHNTFDLRGIRYSTEPGRQALTGSGGLRYAAKILYEIMLAGFLCLTKPSLLAFHGSIAPCPAVHGWAFLCFVGIISTVSRQLRYSPSRTCVCLPPGFLTLWLYLPSCRFAHGYCRGRALCMLVILLRFPSAAAVGSLCTCWLFFYSFPRLLPGACSVRAWYLCMLCLISAGLAWFCSLFARVCPGLAQHHIECHHKAETHHKCYGGAV